MGYQEQNLFISYKYLEANSSKALEKKMLQIQISAKVAVNFTPPQFVNNKFTTWYLYDWSKDVKPQLEIGSK